MQQQQQPCAAAAAHTRPPPGRPAGAAAPPAPLRMPDYPPREGEREKERVGAPALHHQLLAGAWPAFRAAGLAWPASHAAGAWPAPGASPAWPGRR